MSAEGRASTLMKSHQQRLLEEACDDPYSLVLRLVPAWAMPPSAVTCAVRQLQQVAQAVHCGCATLETFLATVDSIARVVPLRAEVERTFARVGGTKGRPIGLDASRQCCLVEVASRYTQLHRAGQLLVGRCPLHDEQHPSFTIYPNGTFFCFGCLQSGNSVDLLARVEGISRSEACRCLRLGAFARGRPARRNP